LLRSAPHLLTSESADEFASLRTALELEIKPKGIVEQIYVDVSRRSSGRSGACAVAKPRSSTPASVPPCKVFSGK
jgi:hypothetical protein